MNKQFIYRKLNTRFYKFILSIIIMSFFVFEVNALTDSNLSNNQMNKSINVISDYELSIMFVKIDNPSNFDTYTTNAVEFMEDIYPVKDNGIKKKIYPINLNSTEFLNSKGISIPITDAETSRKAHKEFVNYLDRLAKSSNVDKVVGVAPVGFISNVLNGNGIGYTYSYLSSGVLVESGYRDVVAHEISHTRAFILCDEYNNNTWNNQNDNRLLLGFIGSGCPNGDKNNDNILDTECLGSGCPTSTIGAIVGQPEVIEIDYYNFMGDLVYPDVWISNDSYNAVIGGFEKGFLGKTLQKIIIYTGAYFKNGTVSIDSSYVIDDAYPTSPEEVIPGNVTINLTNSNNEIIYLINFTPIFSINGKNMSGNLETNLSYFSFSLPYNSTLNKIQFIDKGNIINQKNVTPNTPSVNITYPLGGEVIGSKFNITWNATDADGDNTYYAILISEDNGSNYTTLDLDLNKTYYELDPNDYNQSNDYAIKILATDGINTGNNVSGVFNFGTVSLNITSLQTLYSNGTYRVFEFIIVNDGDATVTDTYWQFDPGDNNVINSTINISSLNSGGSVFVYIEYNYSSSGSFNVKANATGLSESTTTTASLGSSATVGDLLITSFDDLIAQGTIALFEVQAKNVREDDITNINWTFDSDNGEVVNSTQEFNLQPNETIFIFIDYDYGVGGTFNPIATVTNGVYSDSETTSVTTNTAPVITAIPDVTFNEDSYNDTLNLSRYVSDAEDSVEELIWNYESINILVNIDQTTKIANVSATVNWSGSESISFEVRDTSNLSDSDTVLVTVSPVNDPPSFNSSNQVQNLTWPEDNVNISINLTKHFYDIDSSSLNFTASNTGNVSIYIENITGKVNITPDANWSGIAYAVFTAIDSEGLTATSNNLTLNITPVNDAPEFTGIIPQWKWPEDTVNNSLDLTQYFSDIDGDSLKYNFTQTENITISINNDTSIVAFTPDGNFTGIRYTIFTAIDIENLTISSNNVTLNVTPVNDHPIIESYIPTDLTPTVAVGNSLTFNHTSTDIDGDTLTYSWKLDLVEQSTEQGWTYIPAGNEVGTHNITLNVSDGTANATMQWNVTVINESNIDVYDFSVLNLNSTVVIFGFSINNTGNNATSVNWSIDTDEETIFADTLTTLQPNESVFVFVGYNYTTTGDYTAIASATDGIYSDSESITIDVEDVEVANLTALNISGTVGIFEFIIKNALSSTNLSNVSWTFDTKNSNVINSTYATVLQSNEEMFVYLEYNFTTTGTFNVNATAGNGTLIDYRNLTITV